MSGNKKSTLILTEDDFKESIHSKDDEVITPLILVDFHASWCAPCKAIAPKVKRLIAEKYSEQVTLAKVDIDSEPSIASHYNVMTIPTFLLFRKGSTRTKFSPVVGADLKGVEMLIQKGIKSQ